MLSARPANKSSPVPSVKVWGRADSKLTQRWKTARLGLNTTCLWKTSLTACWRSKPLVSMTITQRLSSKIYCQCILTCVPSPRGACSRKMQSRQSLLYLRRPSTRRPLTGRRTLSHATSSSTRMREGRRRMRSLRGQRYLPRLHQDPLLTTATTAGATLMEKSM